MELLLFNPIRFGRLYNCTLYSVDAIPAESRRHTLFGILLILFFVLFELLYLPCVFALYQKRDQSCYKIMLFIALVDIVALPIAGLVPGVFALYGVMFCTAPVPVLVVGICVNMVWCMESSAALLLAANRCLELSCPALGQFLFKGWRTWVWLSTAFAYSLFYGFFTSPAIWSSVQLTWAYNPHGDYLPNMDNLYVNSLDVFHSILITVSIPAIYAMFITVLLSVQKGWGRQNGPSSAGMPGASPSSARMPGIIRHKTCIQVLIISATNAGVSFCYALMGFVSVPPILVIICGTWLWLFLHGHPPLIYLSVNKTIRTQVGQMIPFVGKVFKQRSQIGTIGLQRSVMGQRQRIAQRNGLTAVN